MFVADLSSNQLPGKDECGYISSGKIYGGEITELDEFAWTALLAYKRNGNNIKPGAGGQLQVEFAITYEIN